MANFKFNEAIEEYTTSTPGHADEFNKRQEKLLENDKFLKEKCENIDSELSKKATKDGALQTNLNSEKINNKTANNTALTNEKVDIIGMINEVFTSANNSLIQLNKDKTNLRNAIVGVDSTISIPSNPSFLDLEKAIKNISTGKKWIEGTIKVSSSNTTFNVTGLKFTPDTIILRSSGATPKIIPNRYDDYSLNIALNKSNSILSGEGISTTYTYQKTSDYTSAYTTYYSNKFQVRVNFNSNGFSGTISSIPVGFTEITINYTVYE